MRKAVSLSGQPFFYVFVKTRFYLVLLMPTGWSVSVAELPTCYDRKDEAEPAS